MNRYVVVTLDYKQIAFPVGDPVQTAALLAALSAGVPVESKGYGDDQRWIPTTDQPLQFQFVNADRFTGTDEVAALKAQLAEVKADSERYSKYWISERETTKKLKEQLTANGQTETEVDAI